MAGKEKQDDFQTPKEVLERLARRLFLEIQRFFDSDEGKREFEEWKKNKDKLGK